MTNHAGRKQEYEKDADLPNDPHARPSEKREDGEQGRERKQGMKDSSAVPRSMKRENKAEQVNAQRKDPKQRNWSDILGKKIGRGQEHHRA